jgi:hypothetical protein
MRLRILAVSVMLICFTLIGRSASADTISVQNSSFELSNPLDQTAGCVVSGCAYNVCGIPDWISTGVTGSFNPAGFFSSVPDGSLIAFTNGGTLSQDLGVGLAPNTSYTLNVDVGDRADFNGTYSISLIVGGVTMCSFPGNSASIPGGTFANEACSFGTGSSVPLGDLVVLLSGGSGQADFDNVRVTTPEPASVGLLAFGLFSVALIGGLYKRKQGLQSAA